MSGGVPLAGGWIDTDVPTRMSDDARAAAWDAPEARLLRLRGVQIPVIGEPDAASLTLALVPTVDSHAHFETSVYLGRYDTVPVFAALEHGGSEAGAEPGRDGERWAHPFEAAVRLNGAERELVVSASALLRWHEAEGYSPRDGSPTTIVNGGWARRDAHGAELFPRTDPAVIVLIEHGDRVLLGSNTLWESGRFSLLAGFVEAGETLEQAVAREVYEESGVRVTDIRYVASQPWPFPRSLMLGFRAQFAPGQDPHDLSPDPTEISELRWFSRDEIIDPPPGITLPGGLSIAGWLVREWAAEQ